MEPVEPRSQRDSNWQPLDDLMGRSLELHVSAVLLKYRVGRGYLLYRSFALLKRCEREQSHTSTVARYGTHGGPPGRMTLAQ